MDFNQKKRIQHIILILAILIPNCMLTSQNWEQLGNPPFLKHHTNGFGINGKAYLMEGVTFNNPVSKKVWEYTVDTDTWTQLDDFPGTARGIAIGDNWDGKYYYGFGESATSYLNDLWVFDPAVGSFIELPSCPCIGRAHPAFAAHNDKIFMGSGSSANGDLNDWWEYDMTSQVWTQKPNIPGEVRHHPFFFSIGDIIYVGGGHEMTWHAYNPDTEVWTYIDNYPLGRVAGTQFAHQGKGYVLAGDDADHSHVPDSETFLRYDPEIDSWETLPVLPNGSRWAPSSFIVNDILFYFGGIDFDVQSDISMWKFDLATLDNSVSTDDIEEESAPLISIYPNPLQDKMRFKKESISDASYNISIVNVQGKIILEFKDVDLDDELDVSSIPVGLYFVQLKNEESTQTIRVLKE